ncbi:conserved exported hypothetical protein [Desulfamplus magnetovallimortis]|uniref:Type II secretion system protein n=1 Tax=Desulfamplus magnetovallimortis TaxID=1246637 RepID=A0A1W1H8F8_9BACT|nr:type II secretion system protein [Desulfamplus magnetovallimortis]SLM28665.1 conserved exported hypothetical protein [Desulfamplus magnetovallimortis]
MYSRICSAAGFTYPAVLAMVVIIGIASTSAQKSWTTIVKREKEKELLFRGDQFCKAIESYYRASEDKKKGNYPPSFDDLLKDSRFPAVKRHLRKVYIDPMTGSNDWGMIYTPDRRIKGVFSKGQGEPLKKNGFSVRYSHFNDKVQYSEWKFVYTPVK